MITKNYATFFSKLEKNNNKEWFHQHKAEYENDAKKPFLTLLEKLLPEIKKLEPQISLGPKEALFRINKDLRFSKDQTPYHTLLKAGFSPGGRKSRLPGFYLGMSADKIHVGGGIFMTKGPELTAIRTLIAENTKEFIEIVESKVFTAAFPSLKGEQAKRIDKSFQATLAQTPYIANKQFYAMQELSLMEHLDTDKMFDAIVHAFKTVNPLNQFLKRAFQ